jgi:hypothetical protein
MRKKIKITKALASKVLEVVDAGLCYGLDDETYDEKEDRPLPGHLCVEAAVCYAIGDHHGDRPSCVDTNLAEFKIRLNDSDVWKSYKDRARGLRELAIAQLGTKSGFDYQDFYLRLRMKILLPALYDCLLSQSPIYKFLVSELKTAKTSDDFMDILDEWAIEAMEVGCIKDYWYKNDIFSVLTDGKPTSRKILLKVARASVEVLEEMKTPGSKFLYLAREKKKKAKTVKAKVAK